MTQVESKANPSPIVDRSLTLRIAEKAKRPISATDELEAVTLVSEAVRGVQAVAEVVLSKGRWHEKMNPGGYSTPDYYMGDLMTALDAYSCPVVRLGGREINVDYPAAQITLVRLMGRSDYARTEGVQALRKSHQPISDYTVHEIVGAQPALIPELLGWIEGAPEKVTRPGRGEGSKLRVSDAVVGFMHAVLGDEELSQKYGMDVARICLKLAGNENIIDERMGQLLHETGRMAVGRLTRVVHGSEGQIGLLQDARLHRALMEPVADGFSGKISAKLEEKAKSASKAPSSSSRDGANDYVVQQKQKQEEPQKQGKAVAAMSTDRMRDIVNQDLGQIDLTLVMGAQPPGVDEFSFLTNWSQTIASRYPSADIAGLSLVVNSLSLELEKLMQNKDNQAMEVLNAAESSQDGGVLSYALYVRGLLNMRTILKGLLLNKIQELDATRVRLEREKAEKDEMAKIVAERKKQEEADKRRRTVGVNTGLDEL